MYSTGDAWPQVLRTIPLGARLPEFERRLARLGPGLRPVIAAAVQPATPKTWGAVTSGGGKGSSSSGKSDGSGSGSGSGGGGNRSTLLMCCCMNNRRGRLDKVEALRQTGACGEEGLARPKRHDVMSYVGEQASGVRSFTHFTRFTRLTRTCELLFQCVPFC